MDVIEWEEPPPPGKYGWFFAELVANPGKWAVWPGSNYRTVPRAIEQGEFTGAPSWKFDVRTSVIKDSGGKFDRIWVRYKPEGEA